MNKIQKLFNKSVSAVSKRPLDKNGKVIKTLYHSSNVRLMVGEHLMPKETFDSNLSKRLKCIFATQDSKKLRFFGLFRCLNAGGLGIMRDNKIYLEKIKTNPIKTFYIYTVDSKGFVLDARGEYVRFAETEIKDVKTIDVIDEIKTGGWEVFLPDELPNNLSAYEKSKLINEYIKDGKFKQVDILKILLAQHRGHTAILKNNFNEAGK